MPTTSDGPPRDAGRSADPAAPAAPDQGQSSARETVPLDIGSRPSERETVLLDLDHPGAAELRNRETVQLPRQRGRPGGRTRRAPLIVAAAFATCWAALLSWLPVAVVLGVTRFAEGAGGVLAAAQAGLAAWLLGHGVPLGTSVGPVTLAPLLLTVLALWRLSRAGLHVTRAMGARGTGSPRAALTAGIAVGIGYGALGALAALAVDNPGMTVSPVRAAVSCTAVGVLGALLGSLPGTGAHVAIARRLPRPLRHGIRTGAVAALLVLAAGAGFTGLSVAIGGGQAAEMIGAYRTGVAGQAGITLVSLAYGVNAAIWAAAYLLGPGFLLGTGTTVSLTEVVVGPLPTVPLLAGLPDGPVGAAGAGLLAFPVVAGMAAGWLLTRRLMRARQRAAARRGTAATAPGWAGLLTAAALAGPVAAAVLGGLALVSGGSLGAGRLAAIGPVPWRVAAVSAAVISVSALLGAAARRGLRAHPGG